MLHEGEVRERGSLQDEVIVVGRLKSIVVHTELFKELMVHHGFEYLLAVIKYVFLNSRVWGILINRIRKLSHNNLEKLDRKA